MTAISPAKIKLQATRLAENYTQPGNFVFGLHELLKSYSDQTHRPGRSGSLSKLLMSYNVPQPVLNQILLAMKAFAHSDPLGMVGLCDSLWTEPCLEHQLLSTMLIGLISVDQPEVVIGLLKKWSETVTERRVRQSLIENSTSRLRKETPLMMFQLIQDWLKSSRTEVQQLGLQSLIILVKDPDFQNLPLVFQYIIPMIRSIPASLRPDLIDLLKILSHTSPSETAHAIRTALQAGDNPDAARITRLTLPLFPTDIKDNLRQALKSTQK